MAGEATARTPERNDVVSIRILIVDDHPVVRYALARMIKSQSGMKIVGQAKNGKEAVELALEVKPHIIIMDIKMSGYDGIEATRLLSSRLPDTKVIVLSGHCENELTKKALAAGARSFLLKNAESDEIIRAINVTMEGKRHLSQEIAGMVIDGYANPKAEADSSSSGLLSIRELEVLRLVAGGKSSKEAAVELGISIRTVEKHRFNIMKKLDIHKVSGLVKYAIREGLILVDPHDQRQLPFSFDPDRN